MPQLNFQIDDAAPAPLSLTPGVVLQLRVRSPEQTIHSIALRCQIQIETPKRRYSSEEQERLLDLYGKPCRWSQTLRSLLWTHVSTIVPAFTTETVVDLFLPCSFDFNLAATKYFAALKNGEVPLCLLFSGTIFYEGAGGRLQVEQIPWNQGTSYRMPVAVWPEMMSAHYPNQNWLLLRSDVFERLYHYKRHYAIPTWEQTFESLLSSARTAEEVIVAAGEGM